MKDLQSALSNERGSNASSLQELKESRSRIEALISKVSDLEGANLNLNQKISDMAQNMEDLRSGHRAQMSAKDQEIQRLLDELANQMKEYQNLQDIKIALDMEIAVYRKLLEGEESRLGISQSGSPEVSVTSSAGRPLKRKRLMVEEEDIIEMVSDHTGKGVLIIEPVEKNAKAIKVTNR